MHLKNNDWLNKYLWNVEHRKKMYSESFDNRTCLPDLCNILKDYD